MTDQSSANGHSVVSDRSAINTYFKRTTANVNYVCATRAVVVERIDEEYGIEFVFLGLPDHPSVCRTSGAEIRRQIFVDRRLGTEWRPNNNHAGVRDLRRCSNNVRQSNGSRDGTSKRENSDILTESKRVGENESSFRIRRYEASVQFSRIQRKTKQKSIPFSVKYKQP